MNKEEKKEKVSDKEKSQSKSRWENVKREWVNAFSMSVADDELNENDTKLLDGVAQDIVNRRMASPAIMFLVSVKPVSFLMAQGMQFVKPFMPGLSDDTTHKEFANRFMVSTLIQNPSAYARFALLMESREAVELMIELLEQYEDERFKKERREKREKRKDKKNQKK